LNQLLDGKIQWVPNERYRPLDLNGLFTASTTTGLYYNKDTLSDTLPFQHFGDIEANGVPYKVVDPKNSNDGLNLIILKGGPYEEAYSKSFP